jgi:hypothetical protein
VRVSWVRGKKEGRRGRWSRVGEEGGGKEVGGRRIEKKNPRGLGERLIFFSADFSSATALCTVFSACLSLGTREVPFSEIAELWPVTETWFRKIQEPLQASMTQVFFLI